MIQRLSSLTLIAALAATFTACATATKEEPANVQSTTMTQITLCAHFRVQGLVQGVFFRASTEATARRLGLSGWVRNTEDGEVEIVACGSAPRLDELEKWLWRGPIDAQVWSVNRMPSPLDHFQEFEVRR